MILPPDWKLPEDIEKVLKEGPPPGKTMEQMLEQWRAEGKAVREQYKTRFALRLRESLAGTGKT